MYFDCNDSIAAFTNTTDFGLISNGPGLFQIPSPDFSGFCNDNNYAKFENKIDIESCSRVLSKNEDKFASQCESFYSISKYVTNLWIAKFCYFLIW